MTRESKLVPFFFFAAVFTCTFAKVQWSAGGNLFLADLTAGGFLLSTGSTGSAAAVAPRRARSRCCSPSWRRSCSST